MATYNNSVVVKFDTKENGNSASGASITVYYAGTDSKADITHDSSNPTSNPLFADSNGNYSFEVDDGFYDIIINEGFLSEERIENQQIATIISFDSATGHYDNLQDAIASPIEVGEVITTAGYYTANDGGAGQYIVVAGGTGTDDGGSYLDMVNGNQLELVVNNMVDIKQFGALGTSGDYTLNISNCMNYTGSIFWSKGEYGITEISKITDKVINWVFDDAKIIGLSNSPVGRLIELFIGAGDHNISSMNMDALDTAYIGLRIENPTTDTASLVCTDLSISNVWRSGVDFIGGSGLNVKGWFSRLDLERPTIKNCHLGEGAGISGIVGISGILIEPSSTTPFRAVENFSMIDANIEDVYSDDLLYVIDQDGINFRTAGDDPAIDLPWPTQFNVKGGVFKNCWGRSIKSQSESSYIDNVHLIRTAGNEHNGSDIDLQVGGGSVTRIRCTYEAFTPNWVVTASGSRREDKLVPFTVINDIQVAIANGESINAVANLANREFTRQSWFIQNIVVRGGSCDYAVRMTGGDTSTNIVTLTDVNVDKLNEFLVWSGVSDFSEDAKLIIKRAFHASTPVPVFRANSATSPLLSCEDMFGFDEDLKIDQIGSGTVNSFLRIDRIAPIDAKEGGLIKPVNFVLEDGEIGTFPLIGYNTTTGMLIVSISRTKQSHGIFAFDSGSVVKLTNEGTYFETGTTTEPVSGDFRLWYENGRPNISNRSGTKRAFTCLIIS